MSSKPGRILVIEDNVPNLQLMSYLLTAFGYTVLTATDGAEGLAMARRELVDLIISDIHLPNVDGYQVARALKSHPGLRQVPLIAVTALAMVGDREKVLAAGFDGYIDKPIVPETFVNQIGTFLPVSLRAGAPVPRPVSPEGEEAPRPAPSNHLRVLVLDDSAANRELLRSVLEHGGYQVAEAATITAAVSLATERVPDLILSDLHLGKEAGWQFLDLVRSRPELKRVPFVFLSASWLAGDLGKAESLGADAVLLRPIDSQKVLAALEKVLEKRKEK